MKIIETICAADVIPKKPKEWIYQRPKFGLPFWDSYLHMNCKVIKTQSYESNPFKVKP